MERERVHRFAMRIEAPWWWLVGLADRWYGGEAEAAPALESMRGALLHRTHNTELEEHVETQFEETAILLDGARRFGREDREDAVLEEGWAAVERRRILAWRRSEIEAIEAEIGQAKHTRNLLEGASQELKALGVWEHYEKRIRLLFGDEAVPLGVPASETETAKTFGRA